MINKNKEEIEKILKGCGKDLKRKVFDGNQDLYCGSEVFVSEKIGLKITLCPTCKKRKQERIKTSILWCEFILNDVVDEWEWGELCEQLQTHLTWLNEQEKKL